MTSRTARWPALAIGLVVFVAACGNGAAITAPAATQTPVATPTAVPATTGPITTAGPGQSFDFSSFHADAQLEDLFPDEIGGVELDPISISGQAMLGPGGSPELLAMLTALGKTPADLSAAFAGSTSISIVAFQVDGAQGAAILDALLDVYAGETATITDASFGGKAVKKVIAEGETSYVYAAQDVVFLVTGPVTDALLNEVFSKLP